MEINVKKEDIVSALNITLGVVEKDRHFQPKCYLRLTKIHLH